MNNSWLTPDALRLLAAGILVTAALTAITSVLALFLGVLAGSMRLSPRPLWRGVGAFYVEVHRNVPVLVLIIFYAFAVPNLVPIQTRTTLFFDNPIVDRLGAWSGIPLVYYALAAVLGLSLNTGAYIAELFRAGVSAIPQEHVDAARSLGATRRDAYWRILLPEGLRVAFPAISTRLIHNMKNTSLAALVAVPEFFQSIQTAITRTFRAVEFLLVAAAVYLILAFLMGALLRWIEERIDPRRRTLLATASVGHG